MHDLIHIGGCQSSYPGPRKAHSHGPVIDNKAARTQRKPEWRRARAGQTKLTGYFSHLAPLVSESEMDMSSTIGSPVPISTSPSPAASRLPSAAPHDWTESDGVDEPRTPSEMPSHEALMPLPAAPPAQTRKRARRQSSPPPMPNSEPDAQDSEEEENLMDSCLDAGGVSSSDLKLKEEIRSWDVLLEQIKDDHSKAAKRGAPLAQLNQFLILRHFAHARLKGFGRIAASKHLALVWHPGEGVHFARRVRALARHYQLFEQLPLEQRGGDRGHSLLNDERVQAAARQYLTSLKTGEVTPKLLRLHLNEEIFPSLGLTLKKPLSERTARRWLVKLGWRRTRLKKGVYMDGHERPDVQEYRSNVFLPLMESYERRMVQWTLQDGNLVRVEPVLGPGEKRIIAVFQDESSFHAGEYKANIWYVFWLQIIHSLIALLTG